MSCYNLASIQSYCYPKSDNALVALHSHTRFQLPSVGISSGLVNMYEAAKESLEEENRMTFQVLSQVEQRHVSFPRQTVLCYSHGVIV